MKDNLANYQLTSGFENQAILKSIIIQIALLFGALIVLISIIKGVFMFFMRQTIIVVSRLIEYDLKNVIYQKYQELKISGELLADALVKARADGNTAAATTLQNQP